MFRFLRDLFNLIFGNKFFYYLFKPFTPNAIVLYYHRIINDKDFQQIRGPNKHLIVKKSEFLNQMRFLSKNFEIVHLNKLCPQEAKKKKFQISITFDDGYKDNLDIVYPIIKKLKIPITIFLITRIINGDTFIWWFELWELIRTRKKISFKFKNKNYNFNCDNYVKKEKTFLQLKKIIYKLNIYNQKKIIKIISQKKKIKQYKKYFLNKNDINFLNNDPLIHFGSHGHDHINYKSSSQFSQKKDLSISKRILQNILKKKVNTFCFPYGSYDEVNNKSISNALKFYSKVFLTEQNIWMINNKINPRISIGPNIKFSDFKAKIYGAEMIIKKMISRCWR